MKRGETPLVNFSEESRHQFNENDGNFKVEEAEAMGNERAESEHVEAANLDAETKKGFDESLEFGIKLIREKNWKDLKSFINSLSEQGPIVTQTNLLQRLHEELCSLASTYKGDSESLFLDADKEWASLEASQEIVIKMGNNPNAVPYLRMIVEQSKIPAFILKDGQAAIAAAANSGAEPDRDVRWHYYRAVSEALLKFPTRESYEIIEKIFRTINKQINENTRNYSWEGFEQTGTWYGAESMEKGENQSGEGYGNDMELSLQPRQKETDKENYVLSEYSPETDFEWQLHEAESGMPGWAIAGIGGPEMGVETKNFIIRKLGETKGVDAIPVILEFIKMESSDAPVYLQNILEALKKVDQNAVASQLLNMARSNDLSEKRSALWLLFRLESGNVGVSEDGVHYLQKIYDVGSFNDSNYYVQRITSKGQVGIFSQTGKFEKYFNLDGLDTEQKIIRAQLLDLTYATLYGPHEKETITERAEREQFLKEFQDKYFYFFNNIFFADLSVKFNDLDFAEQGQFLKFYESSDDSEKARIREFCKKFGLDGFRTFLSLDYDKSLGPKILQIGDVLDERASKKVFKKYSEIVDAAIGVQDFVSEKISRDVSTSKEVEKIKEQLLSKAKDLLQSMGEKATVGVDIRNDSVFYDGLEAIRGDILLFAAVCRAFASEFKGDITSTPGVTVEEKFALELSDVEKKQMKNLFHFNRLSSYPDKLRELVERDFIQSLEDSKNIFRLLKHDGKLVAFFHYTKISNDTVYVGSLNLHPSAKDSPVAVAMLKQAIQEKGDQNITAVVWARNPARMFYTKILGFKKVSEIEDYHGTGEEYWELERPSKKAQNQELEKAA